MLGAWCSAPGARSNQENQENQENRTSQKESRAGIGAELSGLLRIFAPGRRDRVRLARRRPAQGPGARDPVSFNDSNDLRDRSARPWPGG